MAIYEVFLSHTYRIVIDAEDKNNAAILSELFVDSSESKGKEFEIGGRKCKVLDVELVENDAFDTHDATLD